LKQKHIAEQSNPLVGSNIAWWKKINIPSTKPLRTLLDDISIIGSTLIRMKIGRVLLGAPSIIAGAPST